MELEYDQKFVKMEQYVPYLENMIKRLETTTGGTTNPRQQQLEKILMLRNQLHMKKKRSLFASKMKTMKWLIRIPCKAYLVLFFVYLYCLCLNSTLSWKSDYITNTEMNDVKYILLWTRENASPFYYFHEGQTPFQNCEHQNCYVTNDRQFFGSDVTKFDAIAFLSKALICTYGYDLPKARSLEQKYILYQYEASPYHPVCSDTYENYFNWTSSYKLSSDIPTPYIEVSSKTGDVVAPKENVNWRHIVRGRLKNSTLLETIQRKTKSIVWLVSSCKTLNHRETFVEQFRNELYNYHLEIDIYGKCGNLDCPRGKICNSILNNYKFYLAFENICDEDYVTEKVYTAVKHHSVPIVYGGADYSRFLPPNSYIDAQKLGPRKLASFVNKLLENPQMLERFFKWREFYDVHLVQGTYNPVCLTCAALNNKKMMEQKSSHKGLRLWLDSNFKRNCELYEDVAFQYLCKDFINWNKSDDNQWHRKVIQGGLMQPGFQELLRYL